MAVESPRMLTGRVQKNTDLGTFEWSVQEVGIRQQGSVIAASGGYSKEQKFYKRKKKEWFGNGTEI